MEGKFINAAEAWVIIKIENIIAREGEVDQAAKRKGGTGKVSREIEENRITEDHIITEKTIIIKKKGGIIAYLTPCSTTTTKRNPADNLNYQYSNKLAINSPSSVQSIY